MHWTAGDQGLPEADTDLAEAALRDDRVVMIAKPLEIPPIAPPKFLEGTGQIAVPDFKVDANGIVHRAFIYYTHEDVTYYSLSLQLVLRYLREQEIYPTNDPDQPELIRIGETAVPIFGPMTAATTPKTPVATNTCWTSRWATTASHPTHSKISTRIRFQQRPCAEELHCWAPTPPPSRITFSTPHSAGRPDDPLMLGMEVHAHAMSQLIRFAHGEAKPITSWSQRAEFGWTLLWCVLGGALGYWNRSGWFTAIAGIGGI